MNPIRLTYVDDRSGGGKDFCLTLPIGWLLDSMTLDDRRELIGYAIASGELLKMICHHISGLHPNPNGYPVADIHLDERTIGDMRQALAPLLSSAIADELKAARELAEENRVAEFTLRSLAHIRHMLLNEGYENRGKQFEAAWKDVERLYPEFYAQHEGRQGHEQEAAGYDYPDSPDGSRTLSASQNNEDLDPREIGGAIGADGNVYSDADPGL